MPPPTGVVNGPLIPTKYSAIVFSVSFGSHSPVRLNAFSPASTSNHSTFRSPPYAFSTAASKTRCAAFQISGPIPSPSINGITGFAGTRKPFSVIVIFSPIKTSARNDSVYQKKTSWKRAIFADFGQSILTNVEAARRTGRPKTTAKKREPKLSFRFPKPTANSFPVGIIPPVTVFYDILIQAAAICFDLVFAE